MYVPLNINSGPDDPGLSFIYFTWAHLMKPREWVGVRHSRRVFFLSHRIAVRDLNKASWMKDPAARFLHHPNEILHHIWCRKSKGWCRIILNVHFLHHPCEILHHISWCRKSKGWCRIILNVHFLHQVWCRKRREWCRKCNFLQIPVGDSIPVTHFTWSWSCKAFYMSITMTMII